MNLQCFDLQNSYQAQCCLPYPGQGRVYGIKVMSCHRLYSVCLCCAAGWTISVLTLTDLHGLMTRMPCYSSCMLNSATTGQKLLNICPEGKCWTVECLLESNKFWSLSINILCVIILLCTCSLCIALGLLILLISGYGTWHLISRYENTPAIIETINVAPVVSGPSCRTQRERKRESCRLIAGLEDLSVDLSSLVTSCWPLRFTLNSLKVQMLARTINLTFGNISEKIKVKCEKKMLTAQSD